MPEIAGLEEAEALADEVLAVPGFSLPLPPVPPYHRSNNDRYERFDDGAL